MFGNRMLVTSLFSTTVFSFYFTCWLDHASQHWSTARWAVILRRLLFFVGCFLFIKLIVINRVFSSPDDDAHIWDILKSKLFPSFRTFDTQLYTCAKEFDFVDLETIVKLCRTGLLPLATIVILRFAYDFLNDLWHDHHDKTRLSHHYHLIQACIHALMGIFIMRLKLFPVPHMCLLISLFMNERIYPKKFVAMKQWKIIVFLFIALGMSWPGRQNLRDQLNVKGKGHTENHLPRMIFLLTGEYSNYPMEKMIEWVNTNTRNDSIFAGTMPTMANLKLSTGRSIVVHPHYEHGKIRRRVKLTYTMFSRKPLRYVHSILQQYHVDYYVYESHWCTITDRPKGCSFPEMYDLDEDDPKILQRTTLACQTLQSRPHPYFQKLFAHDYLSIYAVL